MPHTERYIVKRKRNFAASDRRNCRTVESVFCFILSIEIWKISRQGDEDNVTLILFVYVREQSILYLVHHTTAWEYCFFTHSC